MLECLLDRCRTFEIAFARYFPIGGKAVYFCQFDRIIGITYQSSGTESSRINVPGRILIIFGSFESELGICDVTRSDGKIITNPTKKIINSFD